jgi:hypothetical protein
MRLVKTGTYQKYDWLALKKKFDAEGGTLRDFCERNKLPYTFSSKNFTEINKQEEAQNIEQARRHLARFAPKAAQAMGDLVDSEDDNIKLKASTAIVDRVGLNPQAATISIQNVNATQINIPPMFSSENRDDLAKMLDGEDE